MPSQRAPLWATIGAAGMCGKASIGDSYLILLSLLQKQSAAYIRDKRTQAVLILVAEIIRLLMRSKVEHASLFWINILILT